MAAPPSGFVRTFGYAIATAVRHARACAAIAAVYAGLIGLSNAAARSSTGIFDPTNLSPRAVVAAGIGAVAFFAAVNVLVLPVTLGALSLVGSAEVYGDVVSTRGIVRRALDGALDAVAAFALAALVLVAPPVVLGAVALLLRVTVGPGAAFGVLLFVSMLLVVPGLYVAVRMSLAVPVVMREGRGPVGSLGRSWELVGGGWWWVFGVAVMLSLGIAIVYAVASYLSFIGRDTPADFVIGALLSATAAATGATAFGVASGVVYALRAETPQPSS